MNSDTLEFEYCQRIGLGWTLPGVEVSVRIPNYDHRDWEVSVWAYRDRTNGIAETNCRSIDKSPETAVQELRAAIVWHVEETMQAQIEACVRAHRAAKAVQQRVDAAAE